MKRIQFILFALLLGASTMMISSCNSDACKDKDCGTKGICQDGTCICDEGFEIDTDGKCTIESRAKFIGSYTGAETCTVGTDNYTIGIAAASAANSVILTNVYNQGVTLTATVSGTSLTIASQVITVGGQSYTFSGNGTYTAGTPPKINIVYSITGNPSNSCTFNGNKL